jgi:hypothetical protein
LVVSVGDLADLLAMLQRGRRRKVKLLEVQDDGRRIYAARWRGTDLIVVVTAEVDQVVTFLPRGARQRWEVLSTSRQS